MSLETRELKSRQEAEHSRDAEEGYTDAADFRTFFEMAGAGNVIADADSRRFLRVNRRFCEITGYTEAELRGMTSDMLTDPADMERDRTGWEAVVRERAAAYTIEKRYIRRDGRIIWVEATSTLVRNAKGEALHAIGVIHDVTDRRREVDELRNVRRELEDRVARQIREVTTANAEIKLLERALLESAERECRRIGQELHDHLCQHLLGAAFAAKALANRLPADLSLSEEANDLARLINSAVTQTRELARGLNPVEFDAAGLMAALQQLAQLPRAGAVCRLECDRPVLLPDPRDALHLFRLAEEAVGNATKHSGAKEIVVRLREDEESVFLQITDDGVGFECSPDMPEKPGLENMKYRAHALGGRLWFDTPSGGGTSVTCALPKRK